ncbi:hypothetical protein GCM10022393_34240 [Aquimarina addita]|uniref:SecDF P1 head subdomain domain-containing protein n=1 Tax=Aquimarina addita TaxID=870485 RepID=A0ABP6UPW1_9FLAO
MLFKNYMHWLVLVISLCGFSQKGENIKLSKNPFSDENHVLVYRFDDSYKEDIHLPSIYGSEAQIAVYAKPFLTVKNFKSLEVFKNKKTYDIKIKMDAKGKALLDLYTTDVTDRSIAYVFNDTIYHVHKITTPMLDGNYKISGLTAFQKDHIVAYYKSLPGTALQQSFYKALKEKDMNKADSLVKSGALVVGGRDQGLLIDSYRKKDTLIIDFLKKHDFKPKSKSIYQAMDYGDLEYMTTHFKKLKGTADFQKQLNYKLFSAVKENRLPVVKLLIDLGADPHYKEDELIYYAASMNDCDIIEYLMTLDIKKKNKNEIMGYAAYDNDISILDCLLEKEGFDINGVVHNNASVLHLVLYYDMHQEYINPHQNSVQRIPLLIDRGADVMRKDEDGNTVLHMLAKNIGRYMRNDHNYSFFDRDRIQNSIVSVAKKIIAEGVHPNEKNNEGFTALTYAKTLEISNKEMYSNYGYTTDKLVAYLETLQ